MAAAKLINDVNKIPKWFSLKNYDPVKKFTSADWLEQISIRSGYLFWLTRNTKTSLKLAQGSEYLKLIHSARKNPIIDLSNYVEDGVLFHDDILKLKQKYDLTSLSGVSPITAWQIFNLYHLLPQDLRTEMERLALEKHKIDGLTLEEEIKFSERLQNDRVSIGKKGNEIISQSNDTGMRTIKLDLMLPNNVLIKNFETQLRLFRRKSVYKDYKYRSPNFKKWKEYNLLPYMDLLIWCLETRISIADITMSHVLFSDSAKHKDVVRKTLLPLVKEIINDRHTRAHSAIIAGELLNS